jgi:hypothetical protein
LASNAGTSIKVRIRRSIPGTAKEVQGLMEGYELTGLCQAESGNNGQINQLSDPNQLVESDDAGQKIAYSVKKQRNSLLY